jgi:hypothetical protein
MGVEAHRDLAETVAGMPDDDPLRGALDGLLVEMRRDLEHDRLRREHGLVVAPSLLVRSSHPLEVRR